MKNLKTMLTVSTLSLGLVMGAVAAVSAATSVTPGEHNPNMIVTTTNPDATVAPATDTPTTVAPATDTPTTSTTEQNNQLSHMNKGANIMSVNGNNTNHNENHNANMGKNHMSGSQSRHK